MKVLEAMKTSSLEVTKSTQDQVATNDHGNDWEVQKGNTAETGTQQLAADSVVQQQTANITASKLRLPSLPQDLHLSADWKEKSLAMDM